MDATIQINEAQAELIMRAMNLCYNEFGSDLIPVEGDADYAAEQQKLVESINKLYPAVVSTYSYLPWVEKIYGN